MDLSPLVLTAIMLGWMLFLMMTGMPISFVLLFIAGVSLWILRGQGALMLLSSIAFKTITTEFFLALPTFIFMAFVLEISGLASALYDMMYKWMAGLRGGLAMGTIGISAIMAAMTGSSSTATITMGIISYPEMEKRGYDKMLICGVIPAGGSLGPLIPPSIPMILVASITIVSIGKLFIAGLIPGILCSLGYMVYIGVRCRFDPKMGPPIPKRERVSWQEKLKSLRLAALPVLLIFLVLGLIYLGVSTPTEAGGVGALGALICTAINHNLTFKNLQRALTLSLRIAALVMWLVVTGATFQGVLGLLGIQAYVQNLVAEAEVNRWIILAGILGLAFILGMFMDAAPIAIIFLPVFAPITNALGFDPLWFALVFTMDLIIGMITPPFGMTLFYFKGLNIPGVTMLDVYRAILPFVLIMTGIMVIVVLVPELVTWLPNQMIPMK